MANTVSLTRSYQNWSGTVLVNFCALKLEVFDDTL